MSLEKFFAAAKELPFDERIELGERLWDEFMDGFQGWKAPPIPEGVFAWKTLKAEIDAKLSRDDRIELAQRVGANLVDNGYDPEPTPEQMEELDRRLAEFKANPHEGIPWEQVKAELHNRLGWK